jgi:nicotinamide-nucleotide amidase
LENMHVELITTGTELLCGKILNTHQQWICTRLFDAGFVVKRQVTVPDDGESIAGAVKESLDRVGIVITTGGLGPTSDDLTREAVAKIFGKELVLDDTAWGRINDFFQKRGRKPPITTKIQAYVPKGCLVFQNENGTAPGLVLQETYQGRNVIVALLPGPPRELRPMFLSQLEPLLLSLLPNKKKTIHKTYRTIGIGESYVEERLTRPLSQFLKEGIEVGYCAHPSAVDIRISAQGEERAQLLEKAGEAIVQELGKAIFEVGDRALEDVVMSLLKKNRLTLATAESCTGGHVGDLITNVPGSSEVYLGGIISYSNMAKMSQLGVNEETLHKHGAVSEPTAREMAEGARTRLKGDLGVSITGIAGPSGDTPGKPVGTVFIACASSKETICQKFYLPYDRLSFKEAAARHALNLVRLAIENS